MVNKMAEHLLKLSDISKYYVNQKSVTMGINKISLTMDKGEFIAITGESGSGKSTLAHVIGGILPYEDGELYFKSEPTSHFDSRDLEAYRRENISFISQNYGILEGASVEENVISTLYLSGFEKEEAVNKAKEILIKVDLYEFKHKKAARLSSGQKQRLSIARALSKPAEILIADEPTGNLDEENSIKVIKLLKEASKERLVILITHEFSEAADYATRHIVISEGKVFSDIKLREKEIPDNSAVEKKAVKKNLSFYIAKLQITSRPLFISLMLLFCGLTAFAFFAFLGTFIVNLDDSFTRIYDDSAFSNGSKVRIVAVKKDESTFTDEDYSKILSIDNINAIERYGYCTDIYCSYREGVDFETHYSLENVGSSLEPEFENDSDVKILKSDSFVKTVPLLKSGEFLTEGRLPENLYEVISADSSLGIGSKLPVYIRDNKSWGYNEYFVLNVTVVGKTDVGNGLYFHDDMGRIINYNFEKKDFNFALFAPVYENILPSFGKEFHTDMKQRSTMILPEERFTPESELDKDFKRAILDDEFVPSMTFVKLYGTRQINGAYDESTYDADTGYYSKYTLLFPTREVNDSTLLEFCFVSENTFNMAVPDKGSVQISLTIEDFAYTERVIDALNKAGYNAVSPYKMGTTRQNDDLKNERMQTLTICVAALLAVIILQALVLKAMFNMENESYRLLSNIGLLSKCAYLSSLLQLLFVSVIGQALGYALIFISYISGFERIIAVLHYLPLPYFALLSLIHLLSMLFAFIFIRHSIKKQVYPDSGIKYDLALPKKEVLL